MEIYENPMKTHENQRKYLNIDEHLKKSMIVLLRPFAYSLPQIPYYIDSCIALTSSKLSEMDVGHLPKFGRDNCEQKSSR